jgi:hypothetical protein
MTKQVTDFDGGKSLVQIEHEIRSLRCPFYARLLVNRNAAQTTMNYAPGHDAWIPGTLPEEMEDPRLAALQHAAAARQRGGARRGAA